jgi:hypothetical protein
MRHPKFPLFPSALAAAVLFSAAACSKPAGTVERKTEQTTQTAAGETKTSTETTTTGNTMESKSTTKADTAEGTMKGTVETWVGTVTAYEPGKKIEVMTGEKKKHDVSLDAKDVIAMVDSGVAVGSRVRLTEQTGDDKSRRVTVKLEG